jgi:DNA-binding MarR family transcriptional regulator
MELDRVVHEPVRLRVMMLLSGLKQADFNFLLTTLSLTNGNLSRHVEKLETAGYVKVNKTFKGRMPNTSYCLTRKGSEALARYWKNIDAIRQTGRL